MSCRRQTGRRRVKPCAISFRGELHGDWSEYSTLAERYVRELDAKWLRGGAPADEPLIGSADIQSLADLGNSLEVVRTMRADPITKEDNVAISRRLKAGVS
jgi:hypothetical protein